jgi:hypothetical protein
MMMSERNVALAAAVIAVASMNAGAVTWSAEPIIKHSPYQAVQADGQTDYSGPFPIRLRGVLLNDPEDWLDATFQPDPPAGTYDLAAAWEIFVQAVDLDGTPFDPHDGQAFDDFGGTAAYIAQNYAGLPWKPVMHTYSESEWTAELNRLNYAGGEPGVDPVIGAGDLIELRARGGMDYRGKMNVNEQHEISSDYDFEIVLLQQDYGRPAPAILTLSDLKDTTDTAIFDPNRQTGGEHYQASWVTLEQVRLVDDSGWASDSDLLLTDATGRTFGLHLGMDSSFDTTAAPTGWFDVTGIINQVDPAYIGGYYLIALDAGAFVVPEPASAMLLSLVAAMALARSRRPAGR